MSRIRDPSDYLVFGAPKIEEAEIEELVACVRSGWIGTGPRVARFENAFRAYKTANHAVAVSSCTAALHLSMLAAGLEPGDEVITTPLTFCATVNSIIHAGCAPVLADIDPRTMNIDIREIEARLTHRTRAIIPVHFAGRPCEMGALCALAEKRNLIIIEDCAHAVETTYRGKPAGTIGQFGCFSFYATKNVTTGEGGMVLTRSEEDAATVKCLALHGMTKDAWKRYSDEGFKHYAVVDCGFKYNMTDMQASLGLHQLHRVEKNWMRRRAIWQQYQEAFADLPVECPLEPAPDTKHGMHLYTLLVGEERTGISRDAFLDALDAEGIGTGVHYLSIPEHPFYQEKFGWRPSDYPVAAKIGRETVSLPFSAQLGSEDVGDVIAAVRKVLT